MITSFRLRRISGDLPLNQDGLSARSRRPVPPALGMPVLLACCLFAGHAGISAAAVSTDEADKPAADKPAAVQPAEDDFTRESMAELGRPPAPTPAPEAGTAPKVHHTHARRARPDPKDFAPHHVRFRHHEPEESKPQVAVQAHVHPHARRNPVESFIYGWNGWVIRTFHTKFGTVLLGTVGAKA